MSLRNNMMENNLYYSEITYNGQLPPTILCTKHLFTTTIQNIFFLDRNPLQSFINIIHLQFHTM